MAVNNPILKKIIRKIYYKIKPQDRKFLLKMMPKNAICAEIGVFKGGFSNQILQVTKPKKLHLIDLWELESNKTILESSHENNLEEDWNDIYELVIKKFNNNKNVLIHKGNSEDILKSFNDNYFDWIYIDGDHSYKGVKNDLELSYKKVRINGFITGDDYYENKDYDVINAVDEFIKNYPVELIIIKNTQFIIKKLK